MTLRWMQELLLQALMKLKIMDSHRNDLYETAFKALGTDASPSDNAPDEYGCAESESNIIRKALPELRFPIFTSTIALYRHLLNSPSFVQVSEPSYGCIILSVTGSGNGSVLNGHTGIVGIRNSPDGTPWIMSNDSRNGIWSVNYTLKTWKAFYEVRGGMPTHFFLPR